MVMSPMCRRLSIYSGNVSGRGHFASGFGVSWPVSAVIDAPVYYDRFFFCMAKSVCLTGGELRIWSRALLCRGIWTLSHIATQMSSCDLFAFLAIFYPH